MYLTGKSAFCQVVLTYDCISAGNCYIFVDFMICISVLIVLFVIEYDEGEQILQ